MTRSPTIGGGEMADGDDDPMTSEEILSEVTSAAEKAGIHPAYIHAMEVTGFIVTSQNADLFDDDDIAEWNAAVAEGEAMYGPVGEAH